MSAGPNGPPDHDDAVAPDLAQGASHNANGSAEPLPVERPRSSRVERRAGSVRALEHAFVRLVATSGIVGIAVALAAILGSQKVASWIIGLVVSTLSVLLAALIWSSRTS